jgi:hypothetical protein
MEPLRQAAEDAVDELVGGARTVRDRVAAEAETHAAGEDRPLGGYAALLTTYSAVVVVMIALVRRRQVPLPERPSFRDLVMVGIATHKVSRMIAKDSVLATVRAPFTRYREPAGAGEVNEEVRGTGTRHAVGELVTCPFCLAQWVATGFTFGMLLAPRATRQAAALFCAVAASDALQFGYAKLEQAA